MYMTGKDAPPSCALVLSEDLNVSVYCAHTDKSVSHTVFIVLY